MGNSSSGSENRRVSESVVADVDLAILDLKVQRDELQAYREKINGRVVRDEEAARMFIHNQNKDKAMIALRKKKQHTQILSDCENQLVRVEELIDSIEAATVLNDVVEALAVGVRTLKKAQKSISIDYVQQLMDERAEAIDTQNEINRELARDGVLAEDADALEEYESLREVFAVQSLAAVAGQRSPPVSLVVDEPVVNAPAQVDAPVVGERFPPHVMLTAA